MNWEAKFNALGYDVTIEVAPTAQPESADGVVGDAESLENKLNNISQYTPPLDLPTYHTPTGVAQLDVMIDVYERRKTQWALFLERYGETHQLTCRVAGVCYGMNLVIAQWHVTALPWME